VYFKKVVGNKLASYCALLQIMTDKSEINYLGIMIFWFKSKAAYKRATIFNL